MSGDDELEDLEEHEDEGEDEDDGAERHPLHAGRLMDDLTRASKSVGIHPEYKAYAAVGVYCPGCGTDRRVTIKCLYRGDVRYRGGLALPALALVLCLQCQTAGTITLYDGESGPAVAVLWPKMAGLATPNTPKSVAFYLDQAARAESANAHSAAVAMYRAAVDHLMFAHGYTTGMLGKRIEALIEDIKNNDPKATWARAIDHEYLDVIAKLGNGAIHTNDGDVSKQDAFDKGLLQQLHAVITEILDLVYEEPAKRAARKHALKSVATKLSKKP